ncbi:prolipoprotein diacylglyceryl transferase [Paenibacillus agilis]|uniref:Phosphatidylglycerol--prolipoprotein diacylglyceryl transferase n=1 Tax=Paenibacillus agilis TaxID=3020863 RepID=A0A559ILP5_9BACL|nr:prolipoprotein diacylglyceryl transferase [Paenibacillus agilis]TVX88403.1 prolipoprotein diacylglyceryl transferase [Paenibacillus agilis]
MASTLLDPIAFKLGPISVYWYGLILGSAALAGLLIAMQEGKRFKISQDFFMDLLLLGVPSALIGARAYYVAFKWDEYKHDPIKVFAIWEGGIAIYGALIGAVICAIIYVRRKGYNFWRIADICAPGLLLGQAIGRWGNFMNQEAYGGPVSETFLRDTLNLPNFIVNQMNVQGTFHHPTFLYESIWNIVGVLLILAIRRLRFVRAGEIFIGYLMWYSIGRFFIEGLRTDSLAYQGSEWMASFMNTLWQPMTAVFEAGYLDPNYGNIRISQLIAVVLVLVGIVFIIFRRVTGRAQARYLDPIVSTKADAATSTATDKSAAKTVQHSDHAVAENRANEKKKKDEQ